ncbi:M15 family metallopeptidase ['Paenibacillus yunnanensis' Narsing Rao et al. 2020]|uniref:M15 family metallopeptidase n=1 Tax=Paenibacillus tengchongensis TaxID=2608684 RepID=UPI00124E5E2C|nr:M15 family metallopeptidase [Paenibacillus tengchongensis]
MSRKGWIVILLIAVIAGGWAVGKYTSPQAAPESGAAASQPPQLEGEPQGSAGPAEGSGTGDAPVAVPDEAAASAAPSPQATDEPAAEPGAASAPPAASGNGDAVQTAAEPDSLAALINKQYKLPDDYKPDDLVYPDVPFIFSEKIEKRMLRETAARALEELFAAAEQDGVHLAGVSAYRSQSTQTVLFNNYVKRDGEAKARTYSAVPGHSEHQTGLAIDISGSDGKCAAESCFAGTPEAEWLAQHVQEYGFIIRFPEGKESITGYKYEPWHIRYVGKEIAGEVMSKNITLEEYYDAVPVNN